MDSFRNHWMHLHHNRLNLRTPTHLSPFNALDEGVAEVVYAGVLTAESIIKAWKKWWKEKRDEPFHIVYLKTRSPRDDILDKKVKDDEYE